MQSVVLPGFLDLISSKLSDTGSRRLSVQINERTSTSVWRLKVLNSLRLLLSAVVENNTLGSKGNCTYCIFSIIYTTTDIVVFQTFVHARLGKNILVPPYHQTNILNKR